jgi:hypothetical protein
MTLNISHLSRALSNIGLLWMLTFLLTASWAVAGPAYPLKLSPGQHYVVDQGGTPFLIQGASPWYITEALSQADADFYLSNRWAQGYNSIILDIAASHVTDLYSNDANYYGQYPFTNTIAGGYTNLLSWNVAYFTNVDWVIQRAGHYGICVFAYPLYDDYNGVAWYQQMVGNPTNALFAYGRFIGNRYKNFTNLVWIGAGDYSEPNAPSACLWDWVAAGITSADTNHLISAQASRLTPAIYYSAFATLNSSYPRQFTYIYSMSNYEHTPVLASFMREAYYENSPYQTPSPGALECRQEAYWAVFSGDAGQFYGNDEEWEYQSGWQTQLVSTAATTIPNLGKLMNARPWYNFVPDINHTVVISGYGTSSTFDWIACTREASGKTVMAYIPQDTMTPTVDMTQISGPTASAWWYNPSNGVASSIGSYSTVGTQAFTPPDANDWVLVLDDASQNYPPPGIGVLPRANSFSLLPIGNNVFQFTVVGIPTQTYAIQSAINRNALWQIVGSGTTDLSGTLTLDLTSTSSACYYRTKLVSNVSPGITVQPGSINLYR